MIGRRMRPAALMALWAIAAWLRVGDLGQASALGDAIHPWWAALREGLPRAHAAPYGWGLVMPYKLCLIGAGDLWSAVQRMAIIHAAAAPLAAWLSWRLSGRALSAAVVGAVVALDPGLLDTVRSGAEGYLAPVLLGGMVLLTTAKRPGLAALALPTWAAAVMHHPMALAAAPLLLGLSWRHPAVRTGAGVAMLMLLPGGMRMLGEGLPGGAGQGPPLLALGAYLDQGGPLASIVLLGPLLGLVSPLTRRVSARTLAALALLGALGLFGGYLRDHHLRLLTIPAIVGWAAVPWPGVAAIVLGMLWPRGQASPAELPNQPGTLGLARVMVDQVVAEVPPPLVVDGAWLSGGPAASPAAIMLDLHLRGWTASDLNTGHTVVLIVSADRPDIQALSPEGLGMLRGERHALLFGPPSEVRRWSVGHCGDKLGGAWAALSVLHPDATVDRSRGWWACP